MTALTAADLVTAIKQRYTSPEWHIESEVTLDNRRLDVVALNMWTSRSHQIVGFEMKVSRGDWLRELTQFQKSERWMQVVDGFYVVTPPKLIQVDELPAGWGLLELCGARMMTRKHAVFKEPTAHMPRELAARIIARAHERARSVVARAEWEVRDKITAEVKAEFEKTENRDVDKLRELYNESSKRYNDLLAKLGLSRIEFDQHERILKLAALFADARVKGNTWFIDRLREDAEAATKRAAILTQAVATLDESDLT